MTEPAPVRTTAVIVNWNAGEALQRCLDSLLAVSGTASPAVVLVDNDSHDGSVAQARSRHPSIHVIENRANRGLAAANNQGIVASRSEYVLICNPDVVFAPGALQALEAVLDRHPAAAFAIPQLRYEDGAVQTSAGDLPTLRQALAGRQLTRRAQADAGFWWDGWAHDEERQIGRGHEAAYLVRRAAIEQVGVQDERFFLDWEGVDWTERMRAAGWEVWFTPDAHVLHEGGASIRQVRVRWIVRSHVGIYRYFAKRHPWWSPGLAVVLAARAAAKLAVAVRVDIYQKGHRA
jgi:GT2 family glycosyltransferase